MPADDSRLAGQSAKLSRKVDIGWTRTKRAVVQTSRSSWYEVFASQPASLFVGKLREDLSKCANLVLREGRHLVSEDSAELAKEPACVHTSFIRNVPHPIMDIDR